MVAATASVPRFCARAARRADRVAVRCPTVLPNGGFDVPRNYGSGRCQWLGNLEPKSLEGRRSRAIFHVLIGGRCGPWDLRTGAGRRWPRTLPSADVLRLIGPREQGLESLRALRRIRIGKRPALLVRAAPYPAGGIHGDHVGVLFEAGSDGYLVTGHASPGYAPTSAPVVDALAAVATSMAVAPPA